MEISFCTNRVISGCEKLIIAAQLKSSTPIEDDCINIQEDLIMVYAIKECPGYAHLNIRAKMDVIRTCMRVACGVCTPMPEDPEWIHLFYGTGSACRSLSFQKWIGNRYLTERELDQL